MKNQRLRWVPIVTTVGCSMLVGVGIGLGNVVVVLGSIVLWFLIASAIGILEHRDDKAS